MYISVIRYIVALSYRLSHHLIVLIPSKLDMIKTETRSHVVLTHLLHARLTLKGWFTFSRNLILNSYICQFNLFWFLDSFYFDDKITVGVNLFSCCG